MTSSLIRKFLKNKQCYKRCYGENVERYDIECDRCLWQILIETFGNDLTVIKSDDEKENSVRTPRKIDFLLDKEFI